VELDGASRVAGVASGLSNFCDPPEFGLATDTFVYGDWIRKEAGADLETVCGPAPAVGDEGTRILGASGQLDEADSFADYRFQVPAGADELRIGLNGADFGIVGSEEVANDFDLLVRRGALPTTQDFDCHDNVAGTYGYCELENPEPGTWFAAAIRRKGMGTYQLTVAIVGGELRCVGDCDGNGQVSVDEVVSGVSIALGAAPVAACVQVDSDGDGAVTVDEILTAIAGALHGCT
jgi:hypothetical protein